MYSTMFEKLKGLDNEKKEKKAYDHSFICKVPPSLRSLNVNAYKPLVVDLGLYHHDQMCPSRTEKSKLEAVLRNLQRMKDSPGPLEQKLGVMRKAVEDQREKIMAYYHDHLEFDANKLILDACFVVEVGMVKAGKAEEILEPYTKRGDFTRAVLCDILKLENQVPLCLLKLIINFQENIHCNDLVASILTWACRRVFVLPEEKQDQIRQEAARMLESSSDSPAHLLQCLQRLIIWKISQGNQGNSWHNAITAQKDSVTGKIDRDKSPKTKIKSKMRSIMLSAVRAENLAKAGIAFKAGTPLRFVESFFRMKGVLYLPALHTNANTETLLRNVLAFEECYGILDKKVSRFIFLMDCLLNKKEDVALLRNEELIENCMDTDQAVADMFNGLTKEITTHYFMGDVILEKLQEHYASFRGTVNKFIYTHFSKQWLFNIAVLVLILTIVQTISTIVQTYYTIKPPHA